MRCPGIEPGSTAWKAAMLTTIPTSLGERYCQNAAIYLSGHINRRKTGIIRSDSTKLDAKKYSEIKNPVYYVPWTKLFSASLPLTRVIPSLVLVAH